MNISGRKRCLARRKLKSLCDRRIYGRCNRKRRSRNSEVRGQVLPAMLSAMNTVPWRFSG